MAAHLTQNPRSPTRELLERWKKEEFELIYSTALLMEYQEKFKPNFSFRKKSLIKRK